MVVFLLSSSGVTGLGKLQESFRRMPSERQALRTKSSVFSRLRCNSMITFTRPFRASFCFACRQEARLLSASGDYFLVSQLHTCASDKKTLNHWDKSAGIRGRNSAPKKMDHSQKTRTLEKRRDRSSSTN